MSPPYTYTPRPGEWIRVSMSPLGDCLVGVYEDEHGPGREARIVPAEVPCVAREITEAMHEAAGLRAPVILERPEVTIEGGANGAGGIEVDRLGDQVTVGRYGAVPEELDVSDALRLAALIAVRAYEIRDGEPDPAEVEALAAAIRGLRPSESDRIVARAALKWIRGEQQRGEKS